MFTIYVLWPIQTLHTNIIADEAVTSQSTLTQRVAHDMFISKEGVGLIIRIYT